MLDFIETNKRVLLASCDKILDVSLDAIAQLEVELENGGSEVSITIADFRKTAERTGNVKRKIVKGEALTKEEFIFLGIIMNSNLTILSTNAQRFADAAAQMMKMIAEYTEILKNFEKFNS